MSRLYGMCDGWEHLRQVAVGCWFTSTGRTIPKMIKCQDEEGVIRTIEDIQVIRTFSGETNRMIQRYECEAYVEMRKISFYLLFYPGKNIWKLQDMDEHSFVTDMTRIKIQGN